MRTMWLLPEIGGPFLGCPHDKSSTSFGSVLGPLIFGNSYVSHGQTPHAWRQKYDNFCYSCNKGTYRSAKWK